MKSSLAFASLVVAALMKALTGTVAVSGIILFIIIGATTFSQVLSFSGAVNGLVGLIAGPAVGTVASFSLRLPFFLYAGTLVIAASVFLYAVVFFLLTPTTIWGWIITWMPKRTQTPIDVSGRLAWDAISGYTRGIVIVAFAEPGGLIFHRVGQAALEPLGDGVAIELTAKGTKYFKDGDLS